MQQYSTRGPSYFQKLMKHQSLKQLAVSISDPLRFSIQVRNNHFLVHSKITVNFILLHLTKIQAIVTIQQRELSFGVVIQKSNRRDRVWYAINKVNFNSWFKLLSFVKFVYISRFLRTYCHDIISSKRVPNFPMR